MARADALRSRTDVLVLGAGPAGWAAAAACAEQDLSVRLVAPEPAASWTHTYGAWLDELSAAGVARLTRAQWDRVVVRTVGADLRPLSRTYCLLDNDRLRDRLVDRARDITVTAARAVEAESRGDRVHVRTGAGDSLTARAVIDATGHPAAFGRRSTNLAHQTAYGVIGVFDTPPFTPGTMCLMDFDATPFADAGPPTFLYAMDLGDGRWFVEETSLAARPGVSLDLLRARLERRLAARGSVPRAVLDTERCVFAMNAPLPPAGPAVAFGAAAAMVHPATGYHLAAMLQRAPTVAAALRRAIDDRGDASAVARTAQRAVWDTDDLRRDALYRLGLDVLLDLGTADIQAFFAGFFALPSADWRGYVSRTSSPLELHRTMTRLMLHVPHRLRRRVFSTIVTGGTWRRYGAVVAPRVLSG